MQFSRQKVARSIIAAAALPLAAAACGALLEADGEVPDPVTPAALDYEAVGGIAAFQNQLHIDSASGNFAYSAGILCGPDTRCPRESGSGTLPRQVVDDLFRQAARPEFRALRADYGVTKDGADMRSHSVHIHANARARSLQADDGTMPTLLAQYVHDLESIVRQYRR